MNERVYELLESVRRTAVTVSDLAVDDTVTFIFSGIQFLSTLYSVQYVFDRTVTDSVNSDLHVSLLCHFYQGI